MAENEDGQEKSEKPTGKRLKKAHDQGNIPRSRELGTAMVFATLAITLKTLGSTIGEGAQGWMRAALSPELALLESPDRLLGYFGLLLAKLMWVVAPLVVLVLLACLVSPLVMGGLQFNTKSIGFKPNRMNPLNGLKRMWGPQSLPELAKSLLRVVFLGVATSLTLIHGIDVLQTMLNQRLEDAARTGLHLAGTVLIAGAVALGVLAALDAPYQKWNWLRQLKMTKQEIKEEFKESEGNPQIKGKIRQMQLQMSQRRMMQAVPTADVVLVNPTHYAVALKYDGGKMRAPTLVAKGVDHIAFRIRELAEENRVTIVTAPPLARALYREADLGQEIPVRLYAAVAQVLSYVYQLRAWRTGANKVLPELGQVEVDEFPEGQQP
jgi:flagellar biosynthetic protein FlhB